MAEGLDREACRHKVIKIARDALEKCSETLGAALLGAETGEGQMRGTESLFDRSFAEAADTRGVLHKRSGTTEEFGVPDRVMNAKGTTRGYLDCSLDFGGHLVGFEHKVVRIPRLKNTHPYGSLYDLGQIGIDHYRLEMAGKLSGGYCTVVLHGPLVADSRSSEGVIRHFQNSMFLDYSVSKRWGDLAPANAEDGVSRRQQLASIKRIGLDKPYERNGGHPMNFCAVSREGTLAVVGLWAERRGRGSVTTSHPDE